MREIKFRAWNGKSMFYSHNNQVNSDVTQLTCFFNRLRDTAPIMQYTGLKDKNGKEIYEGDFVLPFSDLPKNDKSIIVYEVNQFRIKGKSLYWNWEADIEVIGNIYENPELL